MAWISASNRGMQYCWPSSLGIFTDLTTVTIWVGSTVIQCHRFAAKDCGRLLCTLDLSDHDVMLHQGAPVRYCQVPVRL